MSDAPKPKKAGLKVEVLKCWSETCNGLLAFEQTNKGYLLGNMIELADRDGDNTFFPCPKCGGRNLCEEFELGGKLRTRVTGFEAA